MGYKTLQIDLPTDYAPGDVEQAIGKRLGLRDFRFQIEKKSLDARKKSRIRWLLNVLVSSDLLDGDSAPKREPMVIPHSKRSDKVVVVGSGPAGFFAAHVLQLAGFHVTILERGSEAPLRCTAIDRLENEGVFSPRNNYAFGEGGAGTFSDGKLTSRSKHISVQRQFILSEYVKAGAPEEILYMAHPHVGTDNLRKVVVGLRFQFLGNGGTVLFDSQLQDMEVAGGSVSHVVHTNGTLEADHVILATGHSAYDTYRMLIGKGVGFGTKSFAIGHRVEHTRELVNQAQWGRESLPGVKAAEYRLTAKTTSGLPVYTFCMCPGGRVVPAAAFENKSVVNGMSYYMRDGEYSNAGCVAGVHPDLLTGHTCSPLEILDWMDALEERFYEFSNSLTIPACGVHDYMIGRTSTALPRSSYPRGLRAAPLGDLIPGMVRDALVEGLRRFSRMLGGFESGVLMGLENKTSSPLRVVRDREGKCDGFENLYFVGEGSGYAGGIISCAADGVRCAQALSSRH